MIANLRAGDFTALTEGGIPRRELIDLAREVVLARIALAEGELRRRAPLSSRP